MSTWKMALRNVGRNGRRSLVTVGAMTLAMFVMLLYGALTDGILAGMERNAVVMDTTQVQIHKKGYREDPDIYGLMEDSDAIVHKLEAQGLRASPRLYGFALGAAGSSSAGVMLRGVDLEREHKVTELHQHLLKGQWLDAADPDGVVIGQKLARTLGVGPGDEVVILGQASDGSMANELYQVRGVLKSVGAGLDSAGFLMPAPSLRELLVLPQGAHEIAVMGELRGDLDALTEKVKADAPEHEVLHWKQLQPVLANLLETSRGSMIFMILLTYTAIALVVFNAMLMSVFERIREFGVLKAVGMPPSRLALMIFGEALLQVAVASVLALGLGTPLAFYMESHGLDLTSFAGDISFGGIAMETVWYAQVTPAAILQPVLFMILLTALAVVWPALKAALIRPVEAFRHT